MRKKSSQVSFKLLKFSDNLRQRPMTNFLRYSHDLSPRQHENSVMKKKPTSPPGPPSSPYPPPQKKITTLIQPPTLTNCHKNNGCKIYYDIFGGILKTSEANEAGESVSPILPTSFNGTNQLGRTKFKQLFLIDSDGKNSRP